MLRDDHFAQVLRLRRAAERCMVLLGSGLLQHPHNVELRERISTGNLEVQQYYRQLQLRLLQIIAWILGEGLGIVPGVESKALYRKHYSSAQLCQTSPVTDAQNVETARSVDHSSASWSVDHSSASWSVDHSSASWSVDHSSASSLKLRRILLALWQSDPEIALTAWGSDLFDPANVPNLYNADLTDEDIGALILTIASDLLLPPMPGEAPARPDIQILGQVHEWLLELQLAVNQGDWSVSLEIVPGHERRTTGSYFTPPDLVENLLDRALEPALDECTVGQSLEAAEKKILQLRVVDPACGTGVFLLAAARRIARRLDQIRRQGCTIVHNKPPTALPEVIAQCLYGVDIVDTAVQLCRLALWFEGGQDQRCALELRQHIDCGNSLFGVRSDFLRRGVPDKAYEPAENDDVQFARALKKRNRRERRASEAAEPPDGGLDSSSPVDLAQLADLWCALFVWPKHINSRVPTQADFMAFGKAMKSIPDDWQREIRSISQRHRVFHWRLRFPEIFGDNGLCASLDEELTSGFDLVIGNPPWAAYAGRSTQHLPKGLKHFMVHSYASFAGFPTTHGVFVELASRVLRKGGRIGFILPASVADLDGYVPARRAHDERCVILGSLPDYGEGRFAGVTQPCIALVSQRTDCGRSTEDRGKPWELDRSDLDATGSALLFKLANLAPLPPELFGERGFQSTPKLRQHIRNLAHPEPPFTLPLREGADVREFQLAMPRLFADALALQGFLRPAAEFAKVTLVVRQTARYPIAAKGDGLAFRNSLLAVMPHEEWSWSLLLCLLNSALLRWCHYFRFRDGRQPILPQLKVSHLRSIPTPALQLRPMLSTLEKLGAEIAARNNGIANDERARLDECVGKLYALDQDEQALVTGWHANRPR